MAPPKPNRGGARIDAVQAARLSETIRKEIRAQQKFLQEQGALGRLVARPPPDANVQDGPREEAQTLVPPPQHGNPTMMRISQNLWYSVNPGYYVRDEQDLCSTTKADFTWDPEEVKRWKQMQGPSKSFNRRRNDVSDYMEQSVKFKNILKS